MNKNDFKSIGNDEFEMCKTIISNGGCENISSCGCCPFRDNDIYKCYGEGYCLAEEFLDTFFPFWNNKLNKNTFLINSLIKLCNIQELNDYTIKDLQNVKIYINNQELDVNMLNEIFEYELKQAKLEGIRNIIPKIQETINKWECEIE